MRILSIVKITERVVLMLTLLLVVSACGESDSSNLDTPNNNGPETTVPETNIETPTIIDESKFPILEQGLIRGVNIQGALRSSIHPVGSTEHDIIQRVAQVVTLLGFNSVRIGGTSSFGSSYDDMYKGFGWSKFADDELVNKIHPTNPYLDEDYNFNVMAIKVAAQSGVSVWIDLSTKSDIQEINLILSLLENHAVPLAGITRDNEPYLPERFEFHESAYNELNKAQYRDAWWPAMYVIKGEQPESRRLREQAIVKDVNTYREENEGIELHIYYPREASDENISPNQWITNALDESEISFGTSKFMVGEWSGKGQETFSDDEIEDIVDSYLTVFKEREIPYYYQLLGSGNEKFGLWNFKANNGLGELNRGAQKFIQHHCGETCL